MWKLCSGKWETSIARPLFGPSLSLSKSVEDAPYRPDSVVQEFSVVMELAQGANQRWALRAGRGDPGVWGGMSLSPWGTEEAREKEFPSWCSRNGSH